jgi:hypothetical protein
MRILPTSVLLFLLAAPVWAWEPEKLLFPVDAGNPIGGAFGSQFVSRPMVYNAGSSPVRASLTEVPVWCSIPGCVNFIQPGTSKLLTGGGGGLGGFLFVDRPRLADLAFSLRAQDLSRQELTWGTELPIIREADLFEDRLMLIDVPDADRFRQTLRIYDWDGQGHGVVAVRVFDQAGGALLYDTEVHLPIAHIGIPEPGQTQLALWTEHFAALRPADALRIEIEPVTPGLRFWAFITITHNETQHITTITPMKLRP